MFIIIIINYYYDSSYYYYNIYIYIYILCRKILWGVFQRARELILWLQIPQALAPSGPPVQGYGPHQGVEARSGDGSQRAGVPKSWMVLMENPTSHDLGNPDVGMGQYL